MIERLFKGVQEMEESTTYQWIIRKGEARGAREMLLEFGGWKLGTPNPTVVAAIEAITDLGRLRALAARLRDVNTWDALLAE